MLFYVISTALYNYKVTSLHMFDYYTMILHILGKQATVKTVDLSTEQVMIKSVMNDE